MEDEAPPASVKLEAIVTDDYDKDAATATAMELSRAEEEAKWSWPGLDEIVQLTAMVADHVAYLPPPPLPPHAPPHASWEGQMVPPPRQYVPPATPQLYICLYAASGPCGERRHNCRTTVQILSADRSKWIESYHLGRRFGSAR
jgi:hypothetical protein